MRINYIRPVLTLDRSLSLQFLSVVVVIVVVPSACFMSSFHFFSRRRMSKSILP